MITLGCLVGAVQVKKQKIMEDNCDQNCVNFMPTGKPWYDPKNMIEY